MYKMKELELSATFANVTTSLNEYEIRVLISMLQQYLKKQEESIISDAPPVSRKRGATFRGRTIE